MPSPGPEFWDEEQGRLYETMLPYMQEMARTGAAGGFDLLSDMVRVGVDWDLVNRDAEGWARQYTYELVRGITNTSQQYLQTAVGNWIDSGMPLEDLVDAISPMFGEVRASMIAASEVTRAYAEGNRAAWTESGVVDGIQWQTAEDERVCPICGRLSEKEGTLDGGIDGQFPPAHVNCRCWILPIVKE